jgi:hypothetical protein
MTHPPSDPWAATATNLDSMWATTFADALFCDVDHNYYRVSARVGPPETGRTRTAGRPWKVLQRRPSHSSRLRRGGGRAGAVSTPPGVSGHNSRQFAGHDPTVDCESLPLELPRGDEDRNGHSPGLAGLTPATPSGVDAAGWRSFPTPQRTLWYTSQRISTGHSERSTSNTFKPLTQLGYQVVGGQAPSGRCASS